MTERRAGPSGALLLEGRKGGMGRSHFSGPFSLVARKVLEKQRRKKEMGENQVGSYKTSYQVRDPTN